MNIQELKEQLKKNSYKEYIFDTSSSFNCLKFMTNGLACNKNDLVLGRSEDFLRFGIPSELTNIVCVGNIDLLLPILSDTKTNCLYIPSCSDIIRLFNRISEEISLYLSLHHSTDILFQSLHTNHDDFSTDVIIDTVNSLFSNPVALFDGNGDILGFRNLDSVYPEILNGFDSAILINSFKDYLNIYKDNLPLYKLKNDFFDKKIRTILGKIAYKDKTMAYCMVFESTHFTGSEITLMPIVCTWLSNELRSGSIPSNSSDTFAHKFLLNLLENRISSDDLIKQQASKLKISKEDYYYILVIDLSKTDTRKGSIRSLAEMLQRILLNGIVTVFDHQLVALLNSKKGLGKEALKSKDICTFLESMNGICGMSYCFRNLKHVPIAYKQALKSIEFGHIFDEDGNLFFYSDCVIYDILDSCGKKEDTMNYCLPQLLDLIEYDKQYNTQYAYTLYILLVTGGKQTLASKSLGIHRTTMQYRIEKITERINLDINDSYNSLRLYLSYGILVQNGKLDPEKYYQL